jgi:hypothetical protein
MKSLEGGVCLIAERVVIEVDLTCFVQKELSYCRKAKFEVC